MRLEIVLRLTAEFWGWIFGAVVAYCCAPPMCYRLERTARITGMEASELLQNRNKCSREGGRGVPPHSCFLRPERWMDVTDVNEL